MSTPPLPWFVVVVVMAALACKGSDGPARNPPPGSPGNGAATARADAAAPGAEGATCANDDGCGFGLVCTSGRCAPSACHDGDPMTPPRVCPGSKHCEFADRTAARKGRGRCVDPAPAPATDDGGAAVPSAPTP